MTEVAWTAVQWASLLVLMYLEFKRRCKCGRTHLPYFWSGHEEGWVMFWKMIWWIGAFVGDLMNHSPFDQIFWGFLAGIFLGWTALRWWYHEKGKLKKKMKELGRVRLNEHGRLVVS